MLRADELPSGGSLKRRGATLLAALVLAIVSFNAASSASSPETASQRPPSVASPAMGAKAPPTRISQYVDTKSRLPNQEGAPADDNVPLPPPPELREGPEISFVLTAVEISGATVYPPKTFAPLYDDLLARAVNQSDIAALVEKITERYRQDGYFLTRAVAPPQTTANGVLQIRVDEGYFADIRVIGDAPKKASAILDKLKAERPARLETVDRTLALIRDIPGVTVGSTQIALDLSDLKKHTLEVEVEFDRLQASLYADNRGTDDAGPYQTYLQVAGNSLVASGDRLTVGIFTIPNQPDELFMAEANYQLPVGKAGTIISFGGAYSKFDAGAFLGTFDTKTKSQSFKIGAAHPLIRNRKTSLWANLQFEGRQIKEEQLGLVSYEDELRVLSGKLSLQDQRGNGITTASLGAAVGLDMLDASANGGSLSRPDADNEFTKFTLNVSRYQNIGKVFGVYAAFSGQSANRPLLASEEFAIGGVNYGRAYDYGELLGDDGLATLVELRYGRNPSVDFIDFLQLYGFFDYGKVWNDNAAPGYDELSMSSAGGGIRLTLPHSVFMSAELARPLDRTPFTQDDRDWRGFFSVSKNF